MGFNILVKFKIEIEIYVLLGINYSFFFGIF